PREGHAVFELRRFSGPASRVDDPRWMPHVFAAYRPSTLRAALPTVARRRFRACANVATRQAQQHSGQPNRPACRDLGVKKAARARGPARQRHVQATPLLAYMALDARGPQWFLRRMRRSTGLSAMACA